MKIKIKKQILIPLLLVDLIALYLFFTTIEAWVFWFAATILAASFWGFKKAYQQQKTKDNES